MFDAQYLLAPSGGTTAVYSPWFPRGADNGRFTAELIRLVGSGTAKLVVRLFHKNADADASYDGTEVDATKTIQITAEGTRTTTEWTGLRELVRYKIEVTETASGGDVWILFRMLDPVWFDTVKA